MARNRIELWGELSDQPELRSTPAGKALLRLKVDCGEPGEDLRLDVVMAGEAGREIGSNLKAGQQVWIAGALRAIWRNSRSGLRERQLEVVANQIEPR